MINYDVDNLKEPLAKLFDPMVISLLSGNSTEVKKGVFVTIKGALDFTVKEAGGNIEVKFNLTPEVKIVKFVNIYGDLKRLVIRPDGIEVYVDGFLIPYIFLKAKS